MKKRKLWIPIVAVLLVAAVAAGFLLIPRMMPSMVSTERILLPRMERRAIFIA